MNIYILSIDTNHMSIQRSVMTVMISEENS